MRCARADRTDYTQIAHRYNEDRPYLIPSDPVLEDVLQVLDRPAMVLDVGCGTGNWLAAHVARFDGRNTAWHGADPTREMLEVARKAVPGALWLQSPAEALPCSGGTFDFVYSSFAFHHFGDKGRALSEMVRVLAPEGALRLVNIDAWSMPDWWVYRYFPAVRPIDEARFWPVDRIERELRRLGLEVEITREAQSQALPSAVILKHAERRVLSQLAVLDDESYQQGLDRIRAEAASGAFIVDEQVVVRLTARRAGATRWLRRRSG